MDGSILGVPVVQELHAKSEGASAGNGLGGSNATLLECLVVSTVSEVHALGDVGVNTLNASVLVVHVQVEDLLLGLADTVENVGLALIATVDAHTQKLLLGVGVLLVGLVQAKNGVGGGSSDGSPGGETTGNSAVKHFIL